MNLNIETNIKIVNIIRRHISDDDIHVYTIDELFLRFDKAKNLYGNCRTKQFARDLMQRILEEMVIYTTVGIGDNMLLVKLALDSTAKKNPEDFMRSDVREGVQIYIISDIKLKFTHLARQFECDPCTVK